MAKELTKIANVAFPRHAMNQNYRIEMLASQLKLENEQIWWLYKENMFSPTTITLLIMDVTIGHIYNVHYSYKSANLREVKWSKQQKYQALNIINSNVMRYPQ